jgi:hypothetical protein
VSNLNVGTRPLGIGLFVFVMACAAAGCRDSAPIDGSAYRDVLFENLIGSPFHYHDQLVRVVGVCQIQFEGTVLWLNGQAQTEGRQHNSLWLNVWPPTPDVKALSGQLVVVEAHFDARHKGHEGFSNGQLDRINRLLLATPDAAHDQRRRAMDGAQVRPFGSYPSRQRGK